MNRYSFTYIGFALALLGVGACSEKPETIPVDDSGTLQITTNIRGTSTSRTTENGFEKDNKIGIFVADANADLPATQGPLYNNAFTCTAEGKWIAGETIYWNKTNTDIYGYYPYQATVSNPATLPVVITNQDRGIESNDFLYSDNVKNLVPGNVAHLLFSHLLSRMDIQIITGKEWDSPADKQRISQTTLKILGTKTQSQVNLKDGEITLGETVDKIIPFIDKTDEIEGSSTHTVILLPQTLAKSTTLIELSIKKAEGTEEQKLYYDLPAGLELLSGYKQPLTIIVNKDNIQVTLGNLEPWLIGEDLNNELNNRPGIHTAQDLIDFATAWNTRTEDPTERQKSLEPWQTVIGTDTIYYLWNDIDLSGIDWTPIGQPSAYTQNNNIKVFTPNFDAIFDGQGFTISNLTLSSQAYNSNYNNYYGMFTRCYGTIRNVKLKNITTRESLPNGVGGITYNNQGIIQNCHIIGESFLNGKYHVGGIATLNYGIIEDCSSNANIKSTSGYAGGLVAYTDYSSPLSLAITNSHTTGDVSGYSYVGGLVAYNEDCPISKCYATGTVYNLSLEDAENSYTGGLVGYTTKEISSSYATGNVIGGKAYSTSYTGGLIGFCAASLENCHATGNVIGGDAKTGATTQSYTGGLVGKSNSYTIENSYATGNVTGGNATSTKGQNYTGGLAGQANNYITNCYSSGDITGCDATGTQSRSYTGGLIGYRKHSTSLTRCSATGKITGGYVSGSESKSYTGGFIGMLETSSYSYDFENNYSSGEIFGGNVSGNNGDSRTGGFIGYNSVSTLNLCHSSGNVWGGDATNYSYTGGFIGENAATVTNCHSSGNILGKIGKRSHTGGFIGENNGSLFNNYSWGQVTGGSITTTNQDLCTAGGLVGNNASISQVSIDNCYVIGQTEGTNPNVGGLIGFNSGKGTVARCYWNNENTRGIGNTQDYTDGSRTLFQMATVSFLELLNTNVAAINASTPTPVPLLQNWQRNEKGLPVLKQQK